MVSQRASEGDADFHKFLDERFARVDERITSLKELIVQRADAGDKALEVAKSGLNEMRGMAADQSTLFLPRKEFEDKHDALTGRVNIVEQASILMRGSEKGSDKVWYVISIGISVLVSVMALVLTFYKTAH
jgi:hypothetical protein